MNDIQENLKNDAQTIDILFGINKQFPLNKDAQRSMVFGVLLSLIFAMLFSYSHDANANANGQAIANANTNLHAINKVTERFLQLETAYSQIKSVGFAWTTMQPLLDNARNAIDNKNIALASDLLLKLEQQILQATIQYKNSQASIDN